MTDVIIDIPKKKIAMEKSGYPQNAKGPRNIHES